MAGKSTGPNPPRDLGVRGRGLWLSVQRSYELDALETETLHELCRVWDRCDAMSAALAAEPWLVEGSTGQMRVNPLVAALESSEKLADRLASSLGMSMPGAAGDHKTSAHQKKAARVRWARAKGASVTPIRSEA